MNGPLPTEVRIRRKGAGEFGQTGSVSDAPSLGKVAVYWGRADHGAHVTTEVLSELELAPPLSVPADKPPEVVALG